MAKSRLQSTLIGLSITSATMNVVGLVLSTENLSAITNGYLAPMLVVFGFFQSMLLVTNHFRQ